MTEAKPNKDLPGHTVALPRSVYDEVVDERERIGRQTGKRPKINELVADAWRKSRAGNTEGSTITESHEPAFSADESAWIQKLTKLLRSDYGEAAQRQITTLYAAMLESGALTRAESALEAANRSDPRAQDLIAEALKAVRDVRSEIEAVERQIDIGGHDRASRKRDSEGGRRSLRRR